MDHFLFSYGTLQLESVQLAHFGRKLTGTKDSLAGYRLEIILIENPSVVNTSGLADHFIAVKTADPADVIQGVVFEVTDKELEHADAYEVPEYRRVSETLMSGARAWVYVK